VVILLRFYFNLIVSIIYNNPEYFSCQDLKHKKQHFLSFFIILFRKQSLSVNRRRLQSFKLITVKDTLNIC